METDIRIERTKTSLRKAFVELLADNHAYNISVTNLTKAAKISRVTFYIHYKDMEDFIEKTCDNVLSEIKWLAGREMNLFKIDNARLIFRKQVESAKENAYVFRALLSDNGPDYFSDKFKNMIVAEYMKPVSKYHRDKFKNDSEMESMVKYVSAGEMQLLSDWVEKEPMEPVDITVDRIMDLTFKGVFASYGMIED